MSEGIIIALITGGLAIISNFIISAQSNSKTLYRIEQLERKMDKYNNLQERVIILEQNDKAQWKYIDRFKGDKII